MSRSGLGDAELRMLKSRWKSLYSFSSRFLRANRQMVV